MGSSLEELPWGLAPRNQSVLIWVCYTPMSGVKLKPGSGSVGLVSAPSHRHTPQHSEILTEAFKSRTFSRKTFCNTSSVLSRQECLLEELSPEGSSLQNGTPPPRRGNRAPRGLCGLVVAVLLPTPSVPQPLAHAELAPSAASSTLLLPLRAACWGFVWAFFGGGVSSAAIKHRHS